MPTRDPTDDHMFAVELGRERLGVVMSREGTMKHRITELRSQLANAQPDTRADVMMVLLDAQDSYIAELATELGLAHATIEADIYGKLRWLRNNGWSLAVANDYRQNERGHTFYLWTKGDTAIKGEARTDADALQMVIDKIQHSPMPF